MALGLVAGSGAGLAAEVQVHKSVGSNVTVTDNVDLAPDGEKRAAVITSVGPSADVTVDGNRLDLLFAGSLDLQHYSDDNSVRVDQNLRGVANAELWKDWLFLDLSGSSTRQLAQPQARVSASGNDRGDRESVTVLSASPYLAHAFGNWADGELRYRHTETFAGQSGDSTQDEQRLSLDSGTRFTRTAAGLLFEHVRDDSDNADNGNNFRLGQSQDLERTTGQVSGKYAVWRHYSATALAGYEKIDTDSSRDLSGPFYLLGVDTHPGPRTDFSLGVGQRYGGLWIQGAFDHELTANLTLTGAVNRVLESTTDRVSRQGRDNVVDPLTGDVSTRDLNNDSENGVAVTWHANLGLRGIYGRDTYDFDAIYVDRQFDTTSDTTYGLHGAWTRQLSRTWSSRLAGFATHVEGEPSSSNTVGARGSLDYLIYSNTVISFGVSHTERFAPRADDEYTESTAFVAGRLQF